MTATPSRVRKYTTTAGDEAIRFDDHILIAPALRKDENDSMSVYTSMLRAGARADLPAPYAEVWVLLRGTIRVGAAPHAVTVGEGEFVHIPEQTPGTVEALEDTTMVCVSVPAH